MIFNSVFFVVLYEKKPDTGDREKELGMMPKLIRRYFI